MDLRAGPAWTPAGCRLGIRSRELRIAIAGEGKNLQPTFKEPGEMTACIASAKKPRIESTDLFQGEREIVIVHQEKEYNLRITRNGKLILTK